MNGFIVSFYDYEVHVMDNEIYQYSLNKIIHFGLSRGFITVEISLFIYSFMIMDKINHH